MRAKFQIYILIIFIICIASSAAKAEVVRNDYDNGFAFMTSLTDDYPVGRLVLVMRNDKTPVALGRVDFARNGYVYCKIEDVFGNRRPITGDLVSIPTEETLRSLNKSPDDLKLLNTLSSSLQDKNQQVKTPVANTTAGKSPDTQTSRSQRNDIAIGSIGAQDTEGSLEISVSNDNRGLVSLKAVNVSLYRILKELAEKTGSNIYFDPSLESSLYSTRVTFSFSKQSVEAGLTDLLGSYGMKYFRNGGSFHVISKGATAQAESDEPVEIEKIVLSYTDADTMRDIILSMDLHPAPEVVKAYVGPMHPDAVQTLDVAGGKNSTKRDMPNEQVVTARKDILLVKATKDVIADIKKIIKLVDVAPRQLIIKTIMLEVDRNNVSDVGADSITFPTLGKYGTASFSGDMDPNSIAGSLQISVASKKTLETATKTLYADLHAMILKQKAKILNNPTISTLDGMPAVIRVGKEIPIESTTVEVKDGINLTSKDVDYRHIGMNLYVLPRIDPDTNKISLLLHPSLSEIETDFKNYFKQSPTNGVLGALNSILGTGLNTSALSSLSTASGSNDPTPDIVIRETNSIVRVDNGEEVIIGGLIRRENKTRVKKVPLFGDMPVLGGLFRREQNYVDEQELIVILVPYIVDSLQKDDKVDSPIYDLIYQDYKHINEKKKKSYSYK